MPSPPFPESAHDFVEEFLQGAPERGSRGGVVAHEVAILKEQPGAYQLEVLTFAFDRLDRARRAMDPDGRDTHWTWNDGRPRWYPRGAELAARLLRRDLPYTEAHLAEFVNIAAGFGDVNAWRMPFLTPLVAAVERHVKRVDSAALADAMERLAARCEQSDASDTRRLGTRLHAMLASPTALPLDPDEPWAAAVSDELAAMNPAEAVRWIELLRQCALTTGSKPTRKWSTAARGITEPFDERDIADRLTRWLPLVDRPRDEPEPDRTYYVLAREPLRIAEKNQEVLKGLCWIAAEVPDASLARALGALTISTYRKMRGFGPRAVKVGNAAVYALGRMPGPDSLAQLALLRVKVKSAPAQKMIARALDAAAERESIPREDIEEMAVPSYGLSDVGRLREHFGEHVAELVIEGSSGAGGTRLSWIAPSGKRVKSVPAAVKRDHADDLKELKAAAKDMQKMLPAQRDRIDGLFIARKQWPYAVWRERYLDHPLIGTIARRLVWIFTAESSSCAGAWLADDADGPAYGAGRLVDPAGAPIEIDEDAATVSLWHPIDPEAPAGTTDTRPDAPAWRAFFEEREIQQPFKQAHREVYLLTDAERRTETYSNRFASHILRQHQFKALCAARGWKNQLRLGVDAEYRPAHRLLPEWGLRAEFWVEGAGEVDPVYTFVGTDQVRYYRIDAAENLSHGYGGGYETRGPDVAENHPLGLASIPPIVLSEILRDIDLFVSVTSVGNDPTWEDGGPGGHFREYWYSYAFGDLSTTAETRRDLLLRIVPRLAIANSCTVTDKFLVVLGKKRTYKIHLGSAQVQMEPGNQYLCIVEGAGVGIGRAPLFLPYEGDGRLAVILSKAFLLARDDKITNPSILSQIDR